MVVLINNDNAVCINALGDLLTLDLLFGLGIGVAALLILAAACDAVAVLTY